jgi:hypothetical protein
LIQDSVGKVSEGTKLVDESGRVLGGIVCEKASTSAAPTSAPVSQAAAGGDQWSDF